MSTSSSSGEPAWAPRPLCEDGLRRRSACGHPMPDLQRDSAFKKMAFELRLLGAHGGSFKRVRRPRRTLRLSGVTHRGVTKGFVLVVGTSHTQRRLVNITQVLHTTLRGETRDATIASSGPPSGMALHGLVPKLRLCLSLPSVPKKSGLPSIHHLCCGRVYKR